MEKFSVTTIDKTLKTTQTQGRQVYLLGSMLQGNIGGLPNWEPLLRAGIFLVISSFNAVSVALVFNPETGHVSPQFHVVFYDQFSTVTFIRGSKIPKKLERPGEMQLTKRSTRKIDLNDTWFTQDIEQYPSENLRNKPSVVPNKENMHNTLVPSPTNLYIHIGPGIKGQYLMDY